MARLSNREKGLALRLRRGVVLGYVLVLVRPDLRNCGGGQQVGVGDLQMKKPRRDSKGRFMRDYHFIRFNGKYKRYTGVPVEEEK